MKDVIVISGAMVLFARAARTLHVAKFIIANNESERKAGIQNKPLDLFWSLYAACRHGSQEVVELLISEYLRDPTNQTMNWDRLLYIAYLNHHRELLLLLVAQGAKMESLDHDKHKSSSPSSK